MSGRAVAQAAKVAAPAASQAVSGTLQRQCACGQHTPGGGECESCKQRHAPIQRWSAYPTEPGNRPKSRVMSAPTVARPFQTKLLVGQAGDMYEQEADSISEQVMTQRESWTELSPHSFFDSSAAAAGFAALTSFPHPAIHPLIQSAESQVAADSGHHGTSAAPEELESQLGRGDGSGRVLPEPTRSFMESRFGFDFSHVRVHSGGDADRMNDEIHSLAFTRGRDIYFASGKYSPGTTEGDRLLAHELTHVIQQSGGSSSGGQASLQTSSLQRYELKRYRGTLMHESVEKKLREKNTDLITEAPIPGGVTGGTALDVVGNADLYISSDKGSVSGVQGEYAKDDPDKRTLEYKKLSPGKAQTAGGPVKSKPGYAGKNLPFVGDFPDEFWVADLKPLGEEKFIRGKLHIGGKIGEGTAQVSHYIEGFPDFARQAFADKKVTKGTMSVDRHRTLTIPKGLDYRNFDTEANSTSPGEGSIIAGNVRYWIQPVPQLGLYVYFPLPHPYKGGAYKKAVDQVFTELKKLTAELRKNKKTADTKLNLKQPKLRTGTEFPSSPRNVRSKRGMQSDRRMLQRKESEKTDWKALGAAWEKKRKAWAEKDAQSFMKAEGAALGEKVLIDDVLGSYGPAAANAPAQENAKEFKGIRLWSGPIGFLLGKARFLLGGAFDKIILFYEKIKARFHGLHTKMQSGPPPGGVGWRALIIKVLVKAFKFGFSQLLTGLYNIFASCFNGIINKVIDQFTEDIEETYADQLKELHQRFESFHDRVKEQFEQTFGNSWETFIETLSDITKWANIVLGLEATIRLIIEAISCLTPPALGCLWGLVAQVGGEVLMELGIPLILNTQQFKDQIVQPQVQKLLKEYAGEEIQGVISYALDKANLQDYAKDVQECNIASAPKGVESLIQSYDILEGSALVAHRDSWQLQNQARLMADVVSQLQIEAGRTPTESEVKAMIEAMKRSNLTCELLRAVFERSKDAQTGKFRMEAIRIGLGGRAPSGPIPTISTQVPPPPRSGVRFGPLDPIRGREGEKEPPGAAGVSIPF
jgi:hypothetical protein